MSFEKEDQKEESKICFVNSFPEQKTIFKRPKKKIEVISRSAQIRSKGDKKRDLTQIKGGFKKRKKQFHLLNKND